MVAVDVWLVSLTTTESVLSVLLELSGVPTPRNVCSCVDKTLNTQLQRERVSA